jgi:hypothetical protein
MFSWFVSLLLFLNFGGRATSVPLTRPSDHGNRHVTPAQDSYPHHWESCDPDGTGSGGGGGIGGGGTCP